MAIEQSYVFGRFLDGYEVLGLNRESMSLTHWLNDDLLQKLSIQKTSNGVEFLTYDKFKDGLWVRLGIYPNYPIADLINFFLGRKKVTGSWHGVAYSKNDPFPKYYCEKESGPLFSALSDGQPINWRDMGAANQLDYNGAYLTSYSGESKTESFYARLIPASFSPFAQISYREDFDPVATLTVDTSFLLGAEEFREIISKGKMVLTEKHLSEDKARNFCYRLHDLFEPFFPEEND